jgi:predicted amidohydrolase YtcJ
MMPFRRLVWMAMCAVPALAQAPDLIVHSGKIVTVDAAFRIASAMVVRGDRIVAVGSDADMLKLAGPKTRKVDLNGRTVLPGLIDSHSHSASASMYEFDHTVPEMETVADVLKYIRGRAAVTKPGEWIVLTQVFITRLKDQRFPAKAELDAAAPKNPVFFGTGPDASVNSLALKAAGIDRNFQVPAGKPGKVERDANGEPTGILRSASNFMNVPDTGRTPTPEDLVRRLKEQLADYNSVGITGVAERDISDGEIAVYEKLKERGELTCRVFLNYHVDAQAPMDKIKEVMARVAASPLHRYDNLLWLRGTKVYLDGGMLTGSAFMLEPWGVSKVYSITDPTYRGMRYIEPGKLYQIFKTAIQNQLQPTAHSVGDGAVTAMVDAYAELNNEMPVKEARPCISHCNFMTADAIRRMKGLGVVADLQPPWLYLDGATLKKQFGDARLEYFQPYKSLAEAGVIVGGGSDHMQKIGSFRSNNPYNPFLGMWITLVRQPRWTAEPLHPEQRLNREQAIRLYTINNAYLTFEEKEKGSLEKGKLADFIVLDRDILTCPVEQVRQIEVLETYLGGKRVFARQR